MKGLRPSFGLSPSCLGQRPNQGHSPLGFDFVRRGVAPLTSGRVAELASSLILASALVLESLNFVPLPLRLRIKQAVKRKVGFSNGLPLVKKPL